MLTLFQINPSHTGFAFHLFSLYTWHYLRARFVSINCKTVIRIYFTTYNNESDSLSSFLLSYMFQWPFHAPLSFLCSSDISRIAAITNSITSRSFYCTSNNLLESINQSTIYVTILGTYSYNMNYYMLSLRTHSPFSSVRLHIISNTLFA